MPRFAGQPKFVPTIAAALMAAFAAVPAFGQDAPVREDAPWLAYGSNTMLRTALEGVEDIEVIISDVLVPPNSSLPAHTHPGEELIYVLEGVAIHREEGRPDTVVEAGDTLTIGVGKVHSPKTTDQPMRAIVVRIHRAGEPERTPADPALLGE